MQSFIGLGEFSGPLFHQLLQVVAVSRQFLLCLLALSDVVDDDAGPYNLALV